MLVAEVVEQPFQLAAVGAVQALKHDHAHAAVLVGVDVEAAGGGAVAWQQAAQGQLHSRAESVPQQVHLVAETIDDQEVAA